METIENKTIASLVTENINTSKIFDKYDIDFGFGKDNTLKNVCFNNGIKLQEICSELSKVKPNNFYLRDYNAWELELLLEFLIDVHHDKKKNDIKLLQRLNNLMLFKHPKHSVFYNKSQLIQDITNKIIHKMDVEEHTIYPYIKQLISSSNNNFKRNVKTPFLANNIVKIEKERIQVCNDVKEVIQLIKDIQFFEMECKSQQLFREKIKSFYYEFQIHNHIEKNILLPKAIAIEKNLIA